MQPMQTTKGLAAYTDAGGHRLNQYYAVCLNILLQQRSNVLIVLMGVVLLGWYSFNLYNAGDACA